MRRSRFLQPHTCGCLRTGSLSALLLFDLPQDGWGGGYAINLGAYMK
jgi:hypothetical protein